MTPNQNTGDGGGRKRPARLRRGLLSSASLQVARGVTDPTSLITLALFFSKFFRKQTNTHTNKQTNKQTNKRQTYTCVGRGGVRIDPLLKIETKSSIFFFKMYTFLYFYSVSDYITLWSQPESSTNLHWALLILLPCVVPGVLAAQCYLLQTLSIWCTAAFQSPNWCRLSPGKGTASPVTLTCQR